ncbi:MAG: GNAT family N-acetyltransferase [Acidimicrobiia bacterium]
MFEPIRTSRLIVRAFEAGDVDAFHIRRNDPEVARYQNWTLPYPRERSEKVVEEIMAMDGPTNDDWWMGTVALADTGEVIGDCAINLTWNSRCSEIGYSLARDHWGHGYAVELGEALVEYLFDNVGVTRVAGTLHPDNIASAMVLERLGFLFEGHTRLSYWVGDENSDDWIYGLTREDWNGWRQRPRQSPEHVELVEITPDNVRDLRRLRTHKSQERFVAPMLASFADALIPELVDGAPVVPWMRGVSADDALVGFVMLADTSERHPEPYLWRLLVDRLHQRRGIGSRILDLVVDDRRSRGDRTLLTSWVPGKGSPVSFYRRRGFEPTGEIVGERSRAG